MAVLKGLFDCRGPLNRHSSFSRSGRIVYVKRVRVFGWSRSPDELRSSNEFGLSFVWMSSAIMYGHLVVRERCPIGSRPRRGAFDFGPILYIEDEVEYLLFDEGEKIVVGSVLYDAGARWGERVAVFRKLLPGESQRIV